MAKQLCRCDNPQSEHRLYIIKGDDSSGLLRGDEPVVAGPLCPGQLEHIDSFGEECEVCNDVTPKCRQCPRCSTWICPPCIDVHFGRCECGTPEDVAWPDTSEG